MQVKVRLKKFKLEVDLKEDLEVERELDSECWRSGITRVEIEGELNRKRRGRTRRERERLRETRLLASFLISKGVAVFRIKLLWYAVKTTEKKVRTFGEKERK